MDVIITDIIFPKLIVFLKYTISKKEIIVNMAHISLPTKIAFFFTQSFLLILNRGHKLEIKVNKPRVLPIYIESFFFIFFYGKFIINKGNKNHFLPNINDIKKFKRKSLFNFFLYDAFTTTLISLTFLYTLFSKKSFAF